MLFVLFQHRLSGLTFFCKPPRADQMSLTLAIPPYSSRAKTCSATPVLRVFSAKRFRRISNVATFAPPYHTASSYTSSVSHAHDGGFPRRTRWHARHARSQRRPQRAGGADGEICTRPFFCARRGNNSTVPVCEGIASHDGAFTGDWRQDSSVVLTSV